MKIKALVSFAGEISMYKGEERECNNKVILSDLINAKYIEEVKTAKLEKSDKNESKSNNE